MNVSSSNSEMNYYVIYMLKKPFYVYFIFKNINSQFSLYYLNYHSIYDYKEKIEKFNQNIMILQQLHYSSSFLLYSTTLLFYFSYNILSSVITY